MKTSKTLATALLAVSTLALAGCYGPQVQVSSGYVAKIVTKTGMSGDIIQPSMFRLNSNCVDCDRATLLEVSDRPIKEQIEVFMPKDQLKLNFDMTGTIRIPNDPKVINNIFDRIPAGPVNPQWAGADDPSRVNIITFDNVYGTYGRDLIREVSRSVVAKYTINQILENRDTIVAEITASVKEKTKGAPIEVVRMSFGAINLPPVIAEAKERGAEREETLRAAEANKQLAMKQQEIELIEADTVRQVDQKLAQNISPVILQQRWLKVMETLAANPNKTVYVMPAQAFGDPTLMMPLLNKAFSGN
jgi:hypothetical protein